MSGPAVTVVMNCCNGEKYLREAIDSVYAQTVGDWEIVFWDNASTDRSAAIATTYDSRLRYFRGERTVPLYAARNCALKHARGEFVGFLDCDDLWLPRKLELQVPLFRSSDALGLVYSNLEILDIADHRYPWYRGPQASGRLFRQLLDRYHLMLPSVLVRRRAIEALGMFDESMTISGDTELFLRLCRDWDAAYVPVITARYREHADNLSRLRPDLFLREADDIVRKLTADRPEVRTEFAVELAGYTARRQKAYIFGLWQTGRNREARALAARNVWSAAPIVLLWVLSFCQYERFGLFRSGGAYRWWRWLKRLSRARAWHLA